MALFGRDTLASHSLTGGKNTKGEKKPALDKTKVDAIIGIVNYCLISLYYLELIAVDLEICRSLHFQMYA